MGRRSRGVAAPEFAPPSPRDLAGAVAAVAGVLRDRAQGPEAGQGVAGVVGRAPRSSPESRMSHVLLRLE